MMDDEREIKRMRLKGLGERVDRWVWSNFMRSGVDESAAHRMGLEVETVRSVRRMFEERKAR